MSGKKIGVPLEGFGQLCRSAAAQGAVLLKNERETLPVTGGERLAVFGRIQKDYYRSGTGSGGAVNAPYATNLLDSLRECDNLQVDEALAAVYEEWIRENPFDQRDLLYGKQDTVYPVCILQRKGNAQCLIHDLPPSEPR